MQKYESAPYELKYNPDPKLQAQGSPQGKGIEHGPSQDTSAKEVRKAEAVAKPEESMVANARLMAQMAQQAATAATGASGTVVAGGAGAGCPGAATLLGKSAGELTAKAEALDKVTKSISSLGTMCSVAGVASGIGEGALAATLQNDISKGMLGMAGAAPGVLSLGMQFLNKSKSPDKSASSQGLFSCISTATSLAEVAVKVISLNDSNKSKKENEEKIKELDDSKSEARSMPDWLELISSPFVARAWAAPAPLRVAACAQARTQPAARVACARAGDRRLGAYLDSIPGGENAFFSAAQQVVGIDRAAAVQVAPGDVERLIASMAREYPEYQPGLLTIFRAAQDKARASLGIAGAGGSDAMQGYSQSDAPAAAPQGGTLFSPESLAFLSTGAGVAQPGDADRAPAGAAPVAAATTPEGIHANRSRSLFDIVGNRYQKSLPEVENKAWELPFNKYSSQ